MKVNTQQNTADFQTGCTAATLGSVLGQESVSERVLQTAACKLRTESCWGAVVTILSASSSIAVQVDLID